MASDGRSSSLAEYERKRDFGRTEEPAPRPAEARRGPLLFVVQKHAATRLHYDFRLELEGVLKSWAVPKGPSYKPKDKRLAVPTEDHPMDYASFEGVIPKGEYGGGEVIVWDAGFYAPEVGGKPLWDREAAERRVRERLDVGLLSVFLYGRKLRGAWSLAKSKKDWLLFKKNDRYVDPERDVAAEDASVLSSLRIEDLKAGRRPDPERSTHLLPDPSRETGARAAPMPRTLAPMLPSLSERAFSHPDWLFEPKLDGYRVLAFVQRREVRLVSRRGLDCTRDYAFAVEELARQPYEDFVLDGEVVALDEQGRPSFQALQNRGKDPSVPLFYYVFDLLYLGEHELTRVPLERRKALLDATIVPSDRLQLVPHTVEDGLAMYRAAQDNGLEGVVAKRRDSVYEPGKRSSAWLKLKTTQSEEFVVGGYTRGTGARAETFGSLLIGVLEPDRDKLRYSGHVGTGFDDQLLRDLKRWLEPLRTKECPFLEPLPREARVSIRSKEPVVWVQPKLVAEVKFADRTKDGVLRAPVFLRLREDKPPRETTGEVLVPPPDARSDGASGREGDEDGLPEAVRLAVEQLQERRRGERHVVEVEGHKVAFNNLDKVFWPRDEGGLSKRDLAVYFARVAPYLLPHLRDRPLTLVRYPDGISGGHFYQKHWPHRLPSFVETVTLYSDQYREDQEYLLCNNLPTLLWLAQMADLELHTWYSRVSPEPDGGHLPESYAGSVENIKASRLNYPDFVVFDLDPYLYSGEEKKGAEPELHREGFARTCEVALWLKEMLDGLELSSFVKTSGKTGLHIYVPILRNLDYEATHAISETLANFLVRGHPRDVTTEWTVEKRTGKVFADYNQNVRGKTLASIYSPRVHPAATVSMPLRWEEVGKVYPTELTIATALQRLEEVGDLWKSILEAKHDLRGLVGG